MSRYKINSNRYIIHVGYDQPLRTCLLRLYAEETSAQAVRFFATVEDPNLPEDDPNYLLLEVGTNYDEIRSVAELAQSIADYCSIPYSIVTKLEENSIEPFEPSYIQSLAEDLFKRALLEIKSDFEAESD